MMTKPLRLRASLLQIDKSSEVSQRKSSVAISESYSDGQYNVTISEPKEYSFPSTSVPAGYIAAISSMVIEKSTRGSLRSYIGDLKNKNKAIVLYWKPPDSSKEESKLCYTILLLDNKGLAKFNKEVLPKLDIKTFELISTEGMRYEIQVTKNFRALVESPKYITRENLHDCVIQQSERIFETFSKDFSLDVVNDAVVIQVNDQKIKCKPTGNSVNMTSGNLVRQVSVDKKITRPLPPPPPTFPNVQPRDCGSAVPHSPIISPEHFKKRVPPNTEGSHARSSARDSSTSCPSDENYISQGRYSTEKRLTQFYKSIARSESHYQILLRGGNIKVDDKYATPMKLPDVDAESIENTLNEQRFHKARDEYCPLGLTIDERIKFCQRLSYTMRSIEGNWKIFACHVMDISDDDLHLIEVFCEQHPIIPVGNIVLDHWHTLYVLRSHNCQLPANKNSIITVLKEMKQFDLLDYMGWA